MANSRSTPPSIWKQMEKGNYSAVRAHLDQGFDPNMKDGDGETLMHKAMRKNRILGVLMLMRRGANPGVRNDKGQTPMELAWDNNNRFLGRLMFKRASLIAAFSPGYRRTVEQAKAGIPANRLPNADESLRVAAMRGDAVTCKVLVDMGANPNAQSENGETALHMAGMAGKMEAVATLLEGGADPCQQDHRGRTAADYAILTNKNDVAKSLITAESKSEADQAAKAKAEADEKPDGVDSFAPGAPAF